MVRYRNLTRRHEDCSSPSLVRGSWRISQPSRGSPSSPPPCSPGTSPAPASSPVSRGGAHTCYPADIHPRPTMTDERSGAEPESTKFILVKYRFSTSSNSIQIKLLTFQQNAKRQTIPKRKIKFVKTQKIFINMKCSSLESRKEERRCDTPAKTNIK